MFLKIEVGKIQTSHLKKTHVNDLLFNGGGG